jgi:hypothetical protein
MLPMASKKEGAAVCWIWELLNLEILTGADNCFSDNREAEITISGNTRTLGMVSVSAGFSWATRVAEVKKHTRL